LYPHQLDLSLNGFLLLSLFTFKQLLDFNEPVDSTNFAKGIVVAAHDKFKRIQETFPRANFSIAILHLLSFSFVLCNPFYHSLANRVNILGFELISVHRLFLPILILL